MRPKRHSSGRSDIPRPFFALRSPRGYVGGRAMCVAFVQQGQCPTLAFWAEFRFDASCPFAIATFIRIKIFRNASQWCPATSELW